jgi:hypothetical protein
MSVSSSYRGSATCGFATGRMPVVKPQVPAAAAFEVDRFPLGALRPGRRPGNRPDETLCSAETTRRPRGLLLWRSRQ